MKPKIHVSAQSVVPVLLKMRSIEFLNALGMMRSVLRSGSATSLKSPVSELSITGELPICEFLSLCLSSARGC
jgi:hypothetical protein